MKGVILNVNPGAAVIDLTHQIQAQNIDQAAFILNISRSYFPIDSIHLVVVDPGVGTSRQALIVTSPDGWYLAPDNGVLTKVIGRYLTEPVSEARFVQLPPELKAYKLSNDRFWLHPVSRTFHGRDIFAPVAAHLSLGVSPEEFGPPVDAVRCLPSKEARVDGDVATGEVLYVDGFGNLITNIPADKLIASERTKIAVAGNRINGISPSYHSSDTSSPTRAPVALVGSHGYLEIAVPDGNAAQNLGVGVGESIEVVG